MTQNSLVKPSKQLDIPITQYKVFKSCKFDDKWSKENEFAHSYYTTYDGAKIKINDGSGSDIFYKFKKNSTVKVQEGFLEFSDKDLLK